MTEAEIEGKLKEAFRSGAACLTIYSRRQDIGIMKCEWGVKHGYLRFEERQIDEQETHWVYHWTSKAKKEWQT